MKTPLDIIIYILTYIINIIGLYIKSKRYT